MDQPIMRPERIAALSKWTARRISRLWRVFARDDRGSVAITMGIVLSVLLGMVALGTEITFIQFKQRQMQAVADAAALSAALARGKGYPKDFKLEGQAVAASGGFVDGVDDAVVTVNNPPQSGTYAKNDDAVEIIIQQPQALRLVGLFTAAKFEVGARAVAMQGTSGGSEFCILSTDLSNNEAVTVNNGAQLTVDDCGLAANATGTPALTVSGGARVEAKSVSVGGTVSVSNGGKIETEEGVLENQSATADPYADVNVNVPSYCDNPNPVMLDSKDSGSLLPAGTYCAGLTIGNGAKNIKMDGTYYIKSGEFKVEGGSEVTGTNVTIVLTENVGSYATATIGNGAKITLTAPTTGETAGMVFFADRNTPNNSQINFEGGANMEFNGSLYFPSMTVIYSNGLKNKSDCTQLIAWHIEFKGGSRFARDCDGTGVIPIGGSGTAIELVE